MAKSQKIKTLTRETVVQIRQAIEKVLKDAKLEKQLGVSVRIGRGRFDSANVRWKLEVSLLNPDGSVETPERAAFKHGAERFGLRPTDLDRTFHADGYTYTVMGLKPKGRRYPILVRRSDGKMFKYPAWIIRDSLRATDLLKQKKGEGGKG